MDILRLAAGLLLPWLAGMLGLAFLEARFSPLRPVNRFRQAGYGFFLGHALLCLLILLSQATIGRVVWNWIVSLMFAVVAAGGASLWFSALGRKPPHSPRPAMPRWHKVLLIVLAGWAMFHVVLVSIEALNQPLYPWDAWLVWVYRAKAWLLAGGLVGIVGPSQWATATSPLVYSIDAWQYPPLPSLAPYWAALSLGRWSEILVNLPAVLAGVAIGLGLYGQSREAGLSPLLSAAACYLLFSIPLFGTHIALAGYADLWMAGFTGLGLVALLRGVISGIPFQTWLGFCLLALAMLVKNEGIVWFLAALLLYVLITWRARSLMLLFVVSIAPLLAARALGISRVELPLIGPVGLVDGQLRLPFIRSFKLEMHDVWGAFGDNFFLLGSWHLLAVLVTAGLIMATLGLRGTAGATSRAATTFILIFIATQFFIFGFTDQGMWASSYTAINRLPLHFLPALLFVPLLIVHAWLSRFEGSPAQPRPTAAGLAWHPGPLMLAGSAALALVCAGLLVILARGVATDSAPALQMSSDDFKFVLGDGRFEDDGVVVQRYADGYALLSSGPMDLEAASYPYLLLTLNALENRATPTFFWRRAETGDPIFRREIREPGSAVVRLGSDPEWRGSISEFGFLFREDEAGGEGPQISRVSLRADALFLRIRHMLEGWFAPEYWSQRSINVLFGGAREQSIWLPATVTAWLLLTLLLTALMAWPKAETRSRELLISGVVAFLLAWAALDLRWTVNSLRQSAYTLEKFGGADEDQRLALGLDGAVYRFVRAAMDSELPASPTRILVLGDDEAVDYYLLRAKYHLLPHSAIVSRHVPTGLTPESIDYLLLFGDASRVGTIAGWNSQWDAALTLVQRGELAALYRVGYQPRGR